jgi:putative methyltransferase (TIGR04325 family)
MNAISMVARFPPANVLRRGIRYVLRRGTLRAAPAASSYQQAGWIAGGLPGGGWNRDSVAVAQEAHWPVLLRNLEGPGPLGVSHLPTRTTREDTGDHNTMMSYAYVLARAARDKQRLRILDWGGGVGHYFQYSRVLMPEIPIEYHCYEVAVLCQLGRRLQPSAHFHEDAGTLAGARFDLVMCSAALHFFEDWRDVARTLVQHTGGFLYVARLMTVRHAPSFVVRQRSQQGYNTQFQGWCLNRTELLECFRELGMELLREFIYSEKRPVENAPEESESRGFLFRPRG